MLIRILLRLAVLTGAIWLTTWLLPDVEIDGGFFTYLWIALLFALVNAVLGPILHLLALPITALTLGLFALVVNAALLGLTALLSPDFHVDGFFTAVIAALLISLFSWLINLFVRD